MEKLLLVVNVLQKLTGALGVGRQPRANRQTVKTSIDALEQKVESLVSLATERGHYEMHNGLLEAKMLIDIVKAAVLRKRQPNYQEG